MRNAADGGADFRVRRVRVFLILLGREDAFADDDGVIEDDAEHDDEGEGGDLVDR